MIPQSVQEPAITDGDHRRKPILTDNQAQQAGAILSRIKHDLTDQLRSLGHGDPSLSSGSCGVSLFLHQYAETFHDDETAINADRLLDASLDRISERFSGPSLYSGFPGVAWAINLMDKTEDIECETIDETLLGLVREGRWSGHFDVIQGIIGLGVYALERAPHPLAIEIVKEITKHLINTAERRGDGITWKTSPSWMPPQHVQMFPKGNYNLGMAHGVPGIIAFLGRVQQVGLASTEVMGLLDDAVHWLLRQQLEEHTDGWFGCIRGDDQPARLAWCYGDPGIAAGLLVAARGCGRPIWEEKAVELALCAASRPVETSGIFDAGICHGAAGLGHLFGTMYRKTGREELRAAAQTWMHVAISMCRTDSGVGGYQSYSPSPEHPDRWRSDPGLLSGAAGIGLALLSAIDSAVAPWDRMLLVSE